MNNLWVHGKSDDNRSTKSSELESLQFELNYLKKENEKIKSGMLPPNALLLLFNLMYLHC